MPIIRDGGEQKRFKPPINQDLAGTPHARWLEDNDTGHDTVDSDHESRITLLEKAMNEGARQTTVAYSTALDARSRSRGINGLPPGGIEKQVVGKLSGVEGHADWVENTVGGLAQQYFDLTADGSEVDLLAEWEAQLFDINITSPADNSPAGVVLPDTFNYTRELTPPFYVLSISVHDHSVDLTLAGPVPSYMDHPDVIIAGATPDGGGYSVTLPAGFSAQWFVITNFAGGDSGRAFPLKDTYHGDRFGTPVTTGAAPDVTATAAAGTGPTVTVTGSSSGGVVELVTGTSPTTTGWGELLTFNDPGWDSGTVPVLQLYPANQDAAALTHYGTRSGTDAEAHFDLTGIAASTTYRFHYSLLPFTAV